MIHLHATSAGSIYLSFTTRFSQFIWHGLLIAMFGLLVPSPAGAAGYWTPLAHSAPGGVGLMLLMPDGTVLAASRVNDPNEVPLSSGSRLWYRLTPDIHGSYVNGTWTTNTAMRDTRLWYSSAVMPDGRVFIAGAEYGTGSSTAEIYDPVKDQWTQLTVPTSIIDPTQQSPALAVGPKGKQKFDDCACVILTNLDILLAPVGPATFGGTVIYHPAANNWSTGPTIYRGPCLDEASLVKLPDNSIVTIEPNFSPNIFGTNSERYLPASDTWINDSRVPVSLFDTNTECGAGLLLPNGKAFFIGATSKTAIYTPSGNANAGSWAAGSNIPGGMGASDAGAAVMVNGKILCAVAHYQQRQAAGQRPFPIHL